MNQLTISALSTSSPEELVTQLTTDGLDLGRVEQIDFAGVQLLVSVYVENRDEFSSYIRGSLPANVLGSLLEEGGAFEQSSHGDQPDLAPLWSQICE